MMRIVWLLTLMAAGALHAEGCKAAILHDLFLDDAKKIQSIIQPKSSPIHFFCDPSEYSESLALMALRMHEITVASISLSRLRSAIPELKFVTPALDETDIMILDHSLAALGFTLLEARKKHGHIYLLISNLTPDTVLYQKITEVLKKI